MIFYSTIGCAKTEYKKIAFKDNYSGNVALAIPIDWKVKDSNDGRYITHEIVPANNQEFRMTLVLNRRNLNPQMFQEKVSEDNIFSLIKHSYPENFRAGLKLKRFGNLAAFGRASVPPPYTASGGYMFYTSGQKNIGENKISFGLLSNDKDESILNELIKIVESVEFKN